MRMIVALLPVGVKIDNCGKEAKFHLKSPDDACVIGIITSEILTSSKNQRILLRTSSGPASSSFELNFEFYQKSSVCTQAGASPDIWSEILAFQRLMLYIRT